MFTYPGLASRLVRDCYRQMPADASQRQSRCQYGRPASSNANTRGKIILRLATAIANAAIAPVPARRADAAVVSMDRRIPISAPVGLAWQPGRIHQLAKMKLIDLIAVYHSMLPNATSGSDQVAHMTAGGWTKDQVITAIRNLEAPYEEVGGWKRAMQIIGACQRRADG